MDRRGENLPGRYPASWRSLTPLRADRHELDRPGANNTLGSQIMRTENPQPDVTRVRRQPPNRREARLWQQIGNGLATNRSMFPLKLHEVCTIIY